MKKEDLLKFCRYYHGEKTAPKKITVSQNDTAFWETEKKWVELTCIGDDSLGNMLDEYLEAGLRDFSQTDDTPATLKAVLFNRYGYWLGGYGLKEDAKQFKTFYTKEYLKHV